MQARKDTKGRNLKKGESQRKDGRYMYRYTDTATGKRISIYGDNLAELREKERSSARDLEDGIGTLTQNTTLNQMFEIYMRTRKIRKSTECTYANLWKMHVHDNIGPTVLSRLHTSQISALYMQMDRAGYAQDTIRQTHILLSAVLELAVDDRRIRMNPAKRAYSRMGKPLKTRIALTAEQQRRFVAFLENAPLYQKRVPLIVIMLWTGCREGKIAALTWGAVDEKKQVLSIRGQLSRFSADPTLIEPPKTRAEIRDIPLNQDMIRALEQQKEWNKQILCDENYRPCDLDFIFLARTKGPMTGKGIYRILIHLVEVFNRHEEQAAQAEGREPMFLPYITPHNLRHTACTRMVEQQVHPKAIQYIMGHQHIDMSMDVCTHVDSQSGIVRDAMQLNRDPVANGVKVV